MATSAAMSVMQHPVPWLGGEHDGCCCDFQQREDAEPDAVPPQSAGRDRHEDRLTATMNE